MKKKKFLPLLAALLLNPLPGITQDSFQYVAGGAYSNTGYDGDSELTMIVGALQLYFTPVSYLDAPYAEAGFLNRQSSLALSIGSIEFDIDFGAITPGLDGTTLGFGFEYANPSSPFTFGVLYNEADADDTVASVNLEFTLEVLGFQLGYYLTNRSRLAFEYVQTDLEFLANGNSVSKSEADSFGLSYRNLVYLERNHFLGYRLGANYIDNDPNGENTEVDLGADYYFARTFSVGAGVVLNTGDDVDDEGTTISINADVFLTPMASIGFEYEQFSADEPDNDDETIVLDFAARF
jgi:hypothetical protein